MIYTIDSKINFGKHKGKAVKDIVYKYPKYIEWAVGAIEFFELHLTKSECDKYLNALNDRSQGSIYSFLDKNNDDDINGDFK